MKPGPGYYFRIAELEEAVLWSRMQGPWGKTLQIVSAHRLYGEVLEVFGATTIVPLWRLHTDGDRVTMTDHLGTTHGFPTLTQALSAIAAAADGSAEGQFLPS